MNSLRLSVCDGGFGGWGKGEAGEATGDLWWPVSVCDRMWFSCYDASAGFVILQSDFSGRFLYVFSRCDLESIAHDNGVLRECDSMRCGRRSIKSKNKERERERERAVTTCLESVAIIMEFEECDWMCWGRRLTARTHTRVSPTEFLLELLQVRLRDFLFQVFFLLSHWISPIEFLLELLQVRLRDLLFQVFFLLSH